MKLPVCELFRRFPDVLSRGITNEFDRPRKERNETHVAGTGRHARHGEGQLTGEDSEWIEVSSDVYQNIRCGAVFKEGKNGQAYWLDGNIFRDQNGRTFTNGYSRVKVDFPWSPPESKVIDVFVEE